MAVRSAIRAICLVAIFVVVYLGCSKEKRDPLNAKERDWLQEHDGKIRLGPDPSAPPLDFFDESGEYQGLTADYVRLIEKKLGFRFEIIRKDSWKELLESAKDREVDVICAAKRTSDRDEYLLFTKAFISVPEVIVTRKDFEGEITIEGLRGKKVTMVEGYAVLEIARAKYPWLSIETSNDLDGLLKVSFNQSDAMLIDLTMVSYLIEKHPIENLRVAGHTDIVIDLGFASRKDFPILNSILEKGLALVTEEEQQEIFDRWIHLGTVPFYRNSLFWMVLSSVLFVSLVVIFVILSLNRILKRQVEERTASLRESLEKLGESEERFRALVGNIPGVTYRFKSDEFLTVEFISAEVETISGYPASDFVENRVRSYASIVYPDDAQLVKDTIKEGVERRRHFNIEYRIVRPDGEFRWVFEKGVGIYDDECLLYIDGVIIDITERKQSETALHHSEERLARSEKMESLGLMAGGIAHDLNNILSGIVSLPELILLDLPANSPLRRPVEVIQSSGMKAAEVVADLLTVARGAAAVKQVSNLNDIVETYVELSEHQKLAAMYAGVAFEVCLESELYSVYCSPVHISKSLMNLVGNAAEAIGGKGSVRIITSNRYVDDPIEGVEDIVPGEYVIVSVSDNGPGISSDDMERLFEPFYSKKVMGRSGTGLGLAIVWNTVQDHSGYVRVISSAKGTTFEMFFHVTKDELSLETKEVPVEELFGQGEKILVIDDDEVQREVACGVLSRLGYDTFAVSSGEDAIDYLKDRSADLLVLDMIMPGGIGGLKTYERIVQIHPGQKAVIASGYSESEDVRKAQKLGAGKYIRKPYTLRALGVVVKETLCQPDT